MKKFFILLSTAVLLTACGKVDSTSPSAPPQETQVAQNSDRQVTEIEMFETGGEDGRAYHWHVFTDENSVNTLLFEDMRMGETKIYELSDADYAELAGLNFADYIGKRDDNDGIFDALYYNITIRYDDETEEKSEVCIPDLWRKFSHYQYECETVSKSTK